MSRILLFVPLNAAACAQPAFFCRAERRAMFWRGAMLALFVERQEYVALCACQLCFMARVARAEE